MATSTPYFLWPAQPSSAAASDLMSVFEFNYPEESAALAATTAAMDMAPLHAPELAEAVARPRLRRQASSGSGRQQQQQQGSGGSGGGGTPKKPTQRGLGVAELERLRCGGVDPLQDLNVAATAAMLEAAAAQGNSNPVIMHHQQDHMPAFDAATGARYYSPLLVQPPPAPQQAPVRYVHGNMAPEQQYFMDRWGRVGGFAPAGNAAGAGGLMQQLQGTVHEQPSSQNTIWRPAPASSPSCLHPGHRCDLCSKTMRALSERASRAPAPAAAPTMPDYSLYDLAAAARKETAGVDGFSAREGKKEVREIEFFPTSTARHADESEPQRITGLSFAPEDDQLITLYLGPKIAGQPLPASTGDFIHEADVYAAHPATLCADFPPASSGIEEISKIWYFFTSPRAKNRRGSRKSRTVGEGKGTWHAEIRKDVVDGEDRFVGYRRTFSHETSSGERSGWLMMEFGFGGNQEQEQENVPVVCKIYKTPRTGKGGCSASARKKRKAKHEGRSGPAAPSAPVRRRLQFRSPPASNPPPATTGFPEKNFSNEPVKQHSEAEKSTPAFDPIAFLASGHAHSALNFNDTTERRQLQFRSPPASDPASKFPDQDFLNEPVKRHSEKEESTPAFDPIAFLASGRAQSCSWTTGSCPGTTVLPTGADWASHAASEQYSKISYSSCTSGTEFLQSMTRADDPLAVQRQQDINLISW